MKGKKMKKIKLSMIALIAIGNMVYAGGDIAPVTYYETYDTMEASVAYEEMETPLSEPVYEPEAVVVKIVPTPKPLPVVRPKPVVVKPIPVPITSPKHISPSGFYAGLGITGSRYQSSCDCQTDSSSSSNLGVQSSKTEGSGTENNVALLARIGYDFNRYIGLEFRGMKTIGSTSKADISHVGLFVKPMVPITDGLNAYGLVGAAKTKVSGSYRNVDAESLALGAGVEFDLSKDTPKEGRYSRSFDGQGDQERGIGLFVDYERLVVKKDSPDLDTLSAGLTYDF
jgi:opacity protein-like surface antigen